MGLPGFESGRREASLPPPHSVPGSRNPTNTAEGSGSVIGSEGRDFSTAPTRGKGPPLHTSSLLFHLSSHPISGAASGPHPMTHSLLSDPLS